MLRRAQERVHDMASGKGIALLNINEDGYPKIMEFMFNILFLKPPKCFFYRVAVFNAIYANHYSAYFTFR